MNSKIINYYLTASDRIYRLSQVWAELTRQCWNDSNNCIDVGDGCWRQGRRHLEIVTNISLAYLMHASLKRLWQTKSSFSLPRYFIELTIRNVKWINHNLIEDYSYLAFWIIVENFRNRIQSSSEPDSLNLNELETFEGWRF